MEEGGLLVRFRVQGDDCPLSDASREISTTIEAWPELKRSDGNVMLQFTAEGDEDELIDLLDDDDRLRYRYVDRTDGTVHFRCLSNHPCVQHTLFDIGFMPLSIRYRDGTEFYRGAVVGHENLKSIFQRAKETVGVSLDGLQQLDAQSAVALRQQWDVTPAQAEAIETALQVGYFGVPREATAEEVAAELGISPSAFLQRLHRAEKRIFQQLFG